MSVIAELTELTVEHADGALHIVDRAGEGPAIVLMHGFPDDHHIYDRLAALLRPRHPRDKVEGAGHRPIGGLRALARRAVLTVRAIPDRSAARGRIDRVAGLVIRR